MSGHEEEWGALWRHPFVVGPTVLIGLVLACVAGQTIESRTSGRLVDEARAMMPRIEPGMSPQHESLESFIGFRAPLWEAQFLGEFPAGGWYRFTPSLMEGGTLGAIEAKLNLSIPESFFEIGFGAGGQAWLMPEQGFYALRIEAERVLLTYAVTGADRVVLREVPWSGKDGSAEIALRPTAEGIELAIGGAMQSFELPINLPRAPISVRTNLDTALLDSLALRFQVGGETKEYRMI